MAIFLAEKAVCYRILAFFCYGKLYFKCESAGLYLFQIRLKELLKLIKRNLASGVVIQIRVVRTRHDVQLFVFAAQRFERVFAEIA